MGNKTKIIFTSIAFCFAFLLAASKISANGCTPIYGGGVTCPKQGEILIDKQVKKADSDLFVDNLTQFDSKYAPLSEVVFKIFVRNTGGETINTVEVKDLMPDFVSFVSGPGTFNQSEGKNGTLTFTLNNLAPSESREYWVKGKVFDATALPETTICKLINRAQARAGDRFNEDVAEFCVEKTTTKGGVPPVQTPATGAEDVLITVLLLMSLVYFGTILRKKAEINLK